MSSQSAIFKALESMSGAQLKHIREYGTRDPLLDRRIEALQKRVQKVKKPKNIAKKKPSNKLKVKQA